MRFPISSGGWSSMPTNGLGRLFREGWPARDEAGEDAVLPAGERSDCGPRSIGANPRHPCI
jgi:hypothetical protein